MQRAWLSGVAGVIGILLWNPSLGIAKHGGHAGGGHAVKAVHEGAKRSGGKPAPHPAPKHPAAKPQAKPQPKPAAKPLPKPQVKPADNHAHKPAAGKATASPKQPNPGSVAKTHQQTNKDDKTTHHDGHHHHEWHHDRWWHGHHHVWSEEGYWVDASTGAPVTGDGAVATVAADAVVTGSTSAPGPAPAVANRPQIHFSVDPSERDAYDAAAQAAGMSRAEWIRSRLNTAADHELK